MDNTPTETIVQPTAPLEQPGEEGPMAPVKMPTIADLNGWNILERFIVAIDGHKTMIGGILCATASYLAAKGYLSNYDVSYIDVIIGLLGWKASSVSASLQN